MTRSTAEIEADIASAREELADTLEALGDRIESQATAPVNSVREHGRVVLAAGSAVVVVTALVIWRRHR